MFGMTTPCFLGMVIGSVIAFGANCASAQIAPDGTLPNNSIVTTDGSTLNITGGTQAGSNLFHSFGEFSVPIGGTASFNNALDIQNIISRVTGGSISNINGIIRANGMANLFLINPNGIVFGQNAQLNVGGSFVASTANALQFGNRGFFSATDKNIPSPLLTINPSALLFNQINQNAAIQNNSVAFTGTDPAGFDAFGLRVPDGKSLLLVGGNVSMDGGELNAYGGRVELGGLPQAGSIALGVDGDNLSLIFPDNVARTDVSLTNQAAIYVEAAGGGNIVVNARNLEILEGTVLNAGIGNGLGTPETVAGDITLNATGSIKVAGTDTIIKNNIADSDSKGNGGNITINSGSFSLQNGARLDASTYGQGNAGNVTVSAKDTVSLAGADENGRDTAILSTVESGGVGNGGNIDINATTVSLMDGAELRTSTSGLGNAGNVTVNALDTVSLAGNILSTVEPGGVGKGGSIDINAATVSLIDGAELKTFTREAYDTQPAGQGDVGNININVTGAVDIVGNGDNGGIFSSVAEETVGNGGNITINSGSFSLQNGARLDASTDGQGNAGNVTVWAKDTVSLAGVDAGADKHGRDTAILSTVEPGGVGNGGNIDINATTVSLMDGAELRTSTSGLGNAGNVTVNALGTVSLAGNIFSRVESGGVGKGGSIDINAATVSLIDGAELKTFTEPFDTQPAGQGDVGNININVTGAVDIVGNGGHGGIFSYLISGTVGNGGNITIDSGSLSLQNGARLETSTYGQGNAGNVTVSAKDTVSLAGANENERNTAIFSTVQPGGVGKGGNINITINSGSLSLQNGARLETSTYGQGNAGNVTVSAKDTVSLAGADENGRNTAIFSRVEPGGVGKGGNIDINAATLSLTDGAQLLTITRQAFDSQPAGQGNAGNVNVKVTGAVSLAGQKNGFVSAIRSSVETGTDGNGGNITIDSGSFSLQNGAFVSASTSGKGNAGTIRVNAADFFTISGKNSDFNSGLFVDSQSPTRTAGDIIVTSPRVTLDNSGTLNAKSASGNGGNINLQTDLLLLRHGAEISTNAGTAKTRGNGGKITINAPSGFIIAVPSENSDITANAFTGSGGTVDIKANGIYGIEFRESPTPLSDITASSEFGTQGTVELNTPGIDPTSGLVELPTVPVDTQVAQGCYSPGYAQNRFVITGRGGLPANPKDILTPDATQIDWVSFKPSNNNRSLPPVTNKPTTSTPKRIVEATGAVLNAKGQIVLTANSSNPTPHTSRHNLIQCKSNSLIQNY